MQGLKLLHNHLSSSCPQIHIKRLSSLLTAVNGAVEHGKLSVTGLGRHIRGKAKVKNKIKQVDRLLSNQHLHRERIALYQAQAELLVGNAKEISVVVDWSPCGNRYYQLLRASLLLEGRSLTLYEEVHSEQEQEKHYVHEHFIRRLKEVLPQSCHVLVITDAGFRGPWFKLVESAGWDWLSRVRGKVLYRLVSQSTWNNSRVLYTTARRKPTFIGKAELFHKHAIPANLYLYKERPRGRKPVVKRAAADARHRTHNIDPWLLATSLKGGDGISEKVIKLYKSRMQIEQTFRDLKNQRWGLSFCEHRTTNIERLQVLVLISTLAIFVLWLIGWTAEQKGMHYGFQANTVKSHRVLSHIFLGRQVIVHCLNSILTDELRNTMVNIHKFNARVGLT